MLQKLKFIQMIILFTFLYSYGELEELSAAHKNINKKINTSEKNGVFPVVEFAELSHNFGDAIQQSKLKHSFTFKNTGKGVLHIGRIKAG